MAVSIKFGSYDFGQTVEEWRERSNIIIDGSSVPLRDGLVIQGGKLGPREIEIRGSLVSTTIAGLRTLRDALRIAVLKKTANLTLNDDRFIEARVSSYADDFIIGSALLALRFTIIFISTIPYFQSVTLQSSGNTTATTSGNQTFDITNNGNHQAYSRITITAPSGGISNDLTVDNLTTGQQFQYFGDIAEAEKLVVNGLVVPPTVLNDGDDDIANYSGDFIRIDSGVNTIQINSIVDAIVLVEWRDTYI